MALSGHFDLPARAGVLEQVTYTGHDSCSYCEEHGDVVKTGARGHVMTFPFRNTVSGHAELRTAHNVEAHSYSALEQNTTVCGFKAPSPLLQLPSFDVVNGIAIDTMHCVFLGVVKQLLGLWFNTKHSTQRWYCGNSVEKVDKRLLEIKPPSVITRVPRSIQHHLKFWKATEYRNWLFYYSLPCLKGILYEEYHQHYALLVGGIILLSGRSISHEQLETAGNLLMHFVEMYDAYYGPRYVLMNQHMLLHLMKSVIDHGPLWCSSLFVFEDWNGDIANYFHGTQNVAHQIMTAVTSHQHLPKLIDEMPPGCAKDLVFQLCGRSDRTNRTSLKDDFYAIGALKKGKSTNADYEDDLLLFLGVESISDVTFFSRLQIGEAVFHSREYKRVSRRNNYTIAYQQGDSICYGYIETFFSVRNNPRVACGAVIAPMSMSGQHVCKSHEGLGSPISHIVCLHEPNKNQFTVVPLKDIIDIFVYIKFSDCDESLAEDRGDSGVETYNNSQDTSKNPSLSSIIRTSPPEPDRYRSNDNIQLFFPFDGGTENSTSAMNSLELPPISAVDHNSESEENMQNSLSTNSPNNAEVEQRNQDVAQETCQNNAEVEETNQDVAQQISHPQINFEEPNQNVEQEGLVCKICPSSGPLEGGGDFQISLKEELPEHIQSGYANFGKEVVVLTKFNKLTLEGEIPAAQEPGVVEVRVFADSYEFLGETNFEYEDMINKCVSKAMKHGSEGVSNLFAEMVKQVYNQSSFANQSSSAKQNLGQATGALNDGCQDRSLPGENTVMDDEFKDLAQHFQDIVKWLSEQSFHPVHSNTDIWLKLSNAVDKLCRKLGFSDNFKGNQQTCPQEREENYFADTENSPYMLSEDDSTSLSDPDNWSETPNELPSKSGDDVKETWKTSTAPDDCPEKSFSPPLEGKPSIELVSDITREVKNNEEEDLYPEVVKAAESMVTGHQFRPNNPTAGQANVVYRDGQNVLENRSLSCAGFSPSLLDASSLETASQFQKVIPSDAYGMDEEKKNGSVLKIETVPSLNSEGVSASGLPAVTLRSSWVLFSEERTSHTLSASRDDTPVPCRDAPAINVENGESQYQDDALFKPPYINAIPKPSESILSVTSNQQSTAHPGPITQEAAQSPVSNPLWNRDSKLNMAPPQCSDEEIHSGQEWEESAIIKAEGLASWFDLCENEDAGKNEHSRWEISSIEPNKTDGGVEKDVFDSEEDLSQEQGLFSEQGNQHIHLSLPDDTSVQGHRPEVENKESQDTSLFTAARNGHSDIVRLLIENGADVNKGGRDNPLFESTPLFQASTNGHTGIVRLLIENGADVNKRGWDTQLSGAARNGHTDIARWLIENKADVKKGEWNTPLSKAATNGHTDIVRLLIENGADVNREGRILKDNPPCEVTRNGHTDIVWFLIENRVDVNKEGWIFKNTLMKGIPLSGAARNGRTDIVRLLIENGADVNKGWDTPLSEAARNGHTDIVRLLIENGADVNKGLGMSLWWAATNGHTDIVRLLIENGADVNEGGGTLLLQPARIGNADIVKLLIENGADVNKGGSYTPLSEAARNGHTDIVRLLIENGIDVNKGLDTPLCEAARNGHTDIVRLLIENGADVNKGGYTPLSEAARNGHTDIVSLLIENGADVSKGERDAPLFEAARNGHSDIVWLLKENVADVNKRLWVTKVPFEREYDVQPKGKKTASLPKMSGEKLVTQTEMTCPRDIVEEGECGRDSMTDVELGLSSLHLSPGCEQFYPCWMDASPGDSRI